MYIQFEHKRLQAIQNNENVFVYIIDLCESLDIKRILLTDYLFMHLDDFDKYTNQIYIVNNKQCYINCNIIIILLSSFSPNKYYEYKEIIDKSFGNIYNLLDF